VDTTRVHNIEISRGTSETLVETHLVAQLEENVCLESADTVPEALLPSKEAFTLVVSLNEYILRGDAVGTSCTYVDSRV
jgi:hypothetical protein